MVESGAGSVRFEFLNDLEVVTGTVRIDVDLRIESHATGDNFRISVREHGSAAKSFVSVTFASGGTTSLSNADSGTGSYPPYLLQETFTVTVTFDMDARTYGVQIGESAVAD